MGPGVVSCIIRFICHIPTGMVGFNGRALYETVANLGDIYDFIPHGRDLLRGLRFADYVGITTFSWNFFQFAASPFCFGAVLGLVGLVDAVLAALLLATLVWQARFLPGGYGPCDDSSNWSNGTDGRNFFVVANQTEDFGYESPNDLCKKMVANWIMVIVVVIFYLICAITNLLLGFGEALFSRHRRHRTGQSRVVDWLLFPLTPVLIFWKPAFYIANHVHAPIHMASRYRAKYSSRKRDPGNAKPKHRNQPNEKIEAVNEKMDHLQPQDTRLPLELVVMIARQVHYSDLVSVSQSSKRLRTVFFGEQEPLRVLRALRSYACDGGLNKAPCAVCTIQTCAGCQTSHLLPQPDAFRHLTHCRPVCSGCFYHNHCLWRTVPKRKYGYYEKVTAWDKVRAQWNERRAPADLQDVEIQAGAQLPEAVCRICMAKSQDQRSAALEAQTLLEAQRLARLPLNCFWCKKQLPETGVRWWIDRRGRECTWEGHPGWV